jgi:hypothetical protein
MPCWREHRRWWSRGPFDSAATSLREVAAPLRVTEILFEGDRSLDSGGLGTSPHETQRKLQHRNLVVARVKIAPYNLLVLGSFAPSHGCLSAPSLFGGWEPAQLLNHAGIHDHGFDLRRRNSGTWEF